MSLSVKSKRDSQDDASHLVKRPCIKAGGTHETSTTIAALPPDLIRHIMSFVSHALSVTTMHHVHREWRHLFPFDVRNNQSHLDLRGRCIKGGLPLIMALAAQDGSTINSVNLRGSSVTIQELLTYKALPQHLSLKVTTCHQNISSFSY